ncbi:MAG: OmpA family protein [Treponema sp.]|nr:OmpA family protein [Treponema sp.]
MKKLVIFLFLSAPLFADNEFSFRVAPAIEKPLSIPEFSSGFGMRVSFDWAFWDITDNLNFGVSAGGLFTSLPFPIGEPLTLIEGTTGAFIRWRPHSANGSLDRWAFRAALKTGIYHYSRADENAVNPLLSFTLGAEYHLSPYFSLFTDGNYSNRVFSNHSGNSAPLTSFGLSVGLRFNLSEIMNNTARVKIEKTEQYRVFPVSWAWYEDNPVAMVKITNEEPYTITDINLSFFMDSFMSQPWTFASLPYLPPGESIELPVTALFNEAMMNLTETVNANGLLQVQYRSLGSRKTTTSSIQMPIFHRNTLSWDDDRRAAAFVSPNDFAARYFARYVASAISNNQLINKDEQLAEVPYNVFHAAALFETLRLYGVSYVVVPATSFVNVSSDESVLDNVSFPYQALYYRGGDCSYLSILFCSLLEALNIESAFITIPGHIYVAFEVGDDTWNKNSDDIIELDGKRWLPLEITVPDEGFTRAWRIGAQQWRNSGDKAEIFPIRDAWKVYPSVTVPASGDHLPEMPHWDTIITAAKKELGLYPDEAEIIRPQITLPYIQFAADCWRLTNNEIKKLEEIADILKNIPNIRISVNGYSTTHGSANFLKMLSTNRAQGVANYLIHLGVSAEITVTGHGSQNPVSNNTTAAGLSANRRVEITIIYD